MHVFHQLVIGNIVVSKDGHLFRVNNTGANWALVSRTITLYSLEGLYEEGARGVLMSVSMDSGISQGKRLLQNGNSFIVVAYSRMHGFVVLSDSRVIDNPSDWELRPTQGY